MALGEKIPEVRIVVAREKTADRRAFQKVIAALPQAGQVATPLIIAVIGGWYNCANSKQHDYQTAVQILNQRESSELASRSAAFEKPMATLLDKSHKIDDRILTLETFLYNFHGIVNARNLLTDLEQELEHSNEPSRGRSKRLRAIARGIANAQRAMIAAAMPREITAACNGDHSPVSLAVAAEANCTIRYSRAWYRYSDQHALKRSRPASCGI